MIPQILKQGVQGYNRSPIKSLLESLAEEHEAEMRADRIREEAMMQQVPQQRGQSLLEVLATGAIDALDRTGRSGAAFQGGLNQGIAQAQQNQMPGYQQKVQQAEMRARALEKGAGYKAKAAQTLYGAQQNAQKQERERLESDRDYSLKLEQLKGRLTVTQWGQLMKLPPESRPMFAQQYLGIQDPGLIDAIGRYTPGESDKVASTQKKDFELNFKMPKDLQYKDAQIGKLGAETEFLQGPKTGLTNAQTGQAKANTGLANAKTATEKKLLDPRYRKAMADVEGVIARTGVSKQQAAKIAKEVQHYDAEFASKLAERKARIVKMQSTQGPSVDPMKVNNEKRKALNDIISVQQKQREVIERRNNKQAPAEGSADWEAYLQIGKELAVNVAELERVAKDAVKGPALAGPIGSQATVTIKKPEPKRGQKLGPAKLPAGWKIK